MPHNQPRRPVLLDQVAEQHIMQQQQQQPESAAAAFKDHRVPVIVLWIISLEEDTRRQMEEIHFPLRRRPHSGWCPLRKKKILPDYTPQEAILLVKKFCQTTSQPMGRSFAEGFTRPILSVKSAREFLNIRKTKQETLKISSDNLYSAAAASRGALLLEIIQAKVL